jgi:hypothetical protein
VSVFRLSSLIVRHGRRAQFYNSDAAGRKDSDRKNSRSIRRGNGFRDLASKQAVKHAIMAGRGNVDLLLTQEQYERLVG